MESSTAKTEPQYRAVSPVQIPETRQLSAKSTVAGTARVSMIASGETCVGTKCPGKTVYQHTPPTHACGRQSGRAADARHTSGSGDTRLTLAYENLIHKGTSRTEAAHTLSRQNKKNQSRIFPRPGVVGPECQRGRREKSAAFRSFAPGIIIQQEVRTMDGVLLVSKGQAVTSPLLLRLKNLHARRSIGPEVIASMPSTTLAFVKSAS